MPALLMVACSFEGSLIGHEVTFSFRDSHTGDILIYSVGGSLTGDEVACYFRGSLFQRLAYRRITGMF